MIALNVFAAVLSHFHTHGLIKNKINDTPRGAIFIRQRMYNGDTRSNPRRTHACMILALLS